ncbi:MAG: ribonuclease HI [Clostridia bacterium]|nr:ribonuclease HI [Clostridia bacterium]
MKHVELFTDGACSGNPGAGGWAAILRYGQHEKELSGGEAQTTNNRMELTAVIRGLAALNERCSVLITTDSQYVVNGIEKGWAASWKRNGWRKADKKPALNADLWDTLLNLLALHDVKFHWVHGHQGHPENERCDALAVAQYQQLKQ